MATVKIEGMNALVQNLKKNADLSRFKPIVMHYTNNLSTTTQELMNARYKGHWEHVDGEKKWVYPTGTTRRTAIPHLTNSGLTGYVAPSTEYFPFLEYGTRYMKARPTLHPAFEKVAPAFKKAVIKEAKKWAMQF